MPPLGVRAGLAHWPQSEGAWAAMWGRQAFGALTCHRPVLVCKIAMLRSVNRLGATSSTYSATYLLQIPYFFQNSVMIACGVGWWWTEFIVPRPLRPARHQALCSGLQVL